MKTLQRTTFEVSRELEFFSEKELEMQIGHGRAWWPIALLKEVIDNALDACEIAGVPPEVGVTVKDDSFTVRDNGAGIPAETVVKSLNYLVRVSDKLLYASPTRGQLGHALKTVYAAPYVADGERGRVEIWAQGLHHTVEVRLDRIRQRPAIDHVVEESDFVKNGTLVRVQLAWSLADEAAPFYKRTPPGMVLFNEAGEIVSKRILPTPHELVESYAAFNPHARFSLGDTVFEPTDADWRKWRPDAPTSAHWYTPETLRDLIAGYVAAEADGGRELTVRAFVSEFRGLSGTAKQKAVTHGLSGVHLRELVRDGDIDMAVVKRLLATMQEVSKPPKPHVLGAIGKAHMAAWMTRCANVGPDSVRYVKRTGDDGLPYVVEVAFGIRGDNDPRRIVCGLNWSPSLEVPVSELRALLQEMRVDSHDPVTLLVHMAKPRFDFTDQAKREVSL